MKRRDFVKAASVMAALGPSYLARCEDATERMPDYAKTGAKLLEKTTAASDGFYYPAEWDPHELTLMVMPPPQNWKRSGIPFAEVCGQWARVANALSDFEPVLMVVDKKERRLAQKLLSDAVELIELPVNDGWARDSGPMFLVDNQGNRRVAGFTFNGWGAKFPPFADDALLKARLCSKLKVPMYPIDLVLEGGAVAVDGEGTLLTTEQCLLNKNRNAKMDRNRVEEILNQSLGTKKVIWLGKGLEPDPITDGHIDGLAAFAAPGVVLLHVTGDRTDPNFAICEDAKHRLQEVTDARGRKLEVVEVPLDGNLSHMNFYIANDAVLVPIEGRKSHDERPLAILREVFPNRRVIGIDCNLLGEGGGGIHCITQQVPKV